MSTQAQNPLLCENKAQVSVPADFLNTVNRLIWAAQRRDNTMGDPCTLIAAKEELRAATQDCAQALRALQDSA